MQYILKAKIQYWIKKKIYHRLIRCDLKDRIFSLIKQQKEGLSSKKYYEYEQSREKKL